MIEPTGRTGRATLLLLPQAQAYGEIYAFRIADGTTVRVTHNRREDGAPSWERGVPR